MFLKSRKHFSISFEDLQCRTRLELQSLLAENSFLFKTVVYIIFATNSVSQKDLESMLLSIRIFLRYFFHDCVQSHSITDKNLSYSCGSFKPQGFFKVTLNQRVIIVSQLSRCLKCEAIRGDQTDQRNCI